MGDKQEQSKKWREILSSNRLLTDGTYTKFLTYQATINGSSVAGIVAFSLKATEKMFGASNILFDAYKLECYN